MTCRTQIDARVRELQLIHIAKRDLGLDDETYRAMLREVAGVDSAADLDAAGRRKVLDRLKARGFRVRRSRQGVAAPNRRRDDRIDWRQPRVDKILKLWYLLRDGGALRGDGSEAQLWRFCAKLTGVTKIEWATSPGLNRCIEALGAWCRREGIPLHD